MPQPQYATLHQLREHELEHQVYIKDLELRLVREIHASRNVLLAAILPLYGTVIVMLIFLYNSKP
jgi:hypothetical protein